MCVYFCMYLLSYGGRMTATTNIALMQSPGHSKHFCMFYHLINHTTMYIFCLNNSCSYTTCLNIPQIEFQNLGQSNYYRASENYNNNNNSLIIVIDIIFIFCNIYQPTKDKVNLLLSFSFNSVFFLMNQNLVQ